MAGTSRQVKREVETVAARAEALMKLAPSSGQFYEQILTAFGIGAVNVLVLAPEGENVFVVINIVVWCGVALLALSVVGLISLRVVAFRDWLNELAVDRQYRMDEERLPVRRDTSLMKQQLVRAGLRRPSGAQPRGYRSPA